MPNQIIQISIELLEIMYSYGFDSFFNGNLEELLPSYSTKDIKTVVNNLHKSGKIRAFGIKQLTLKFFLKQFSGHMTDIGILEFENYDFSDNNKYSIEIARFLEVIDEAEEENLYTNEIVNRVRTKGSKRTEQELESLFSMIIKYTCKVQRIFSSNKYRHLSINNKISPLTDYGYRVLNLFKTSNQLFQSSVITNQDMLRKEYNNLQLFIDNQLWKDVCVKMGAILEYLLTKWLKSKGVTHITHTQRKKPKDIKYASFWDKIMYYLETARKDFNNEIGDNTSWSIVNDVIRDFFNEGIHNGQWYISINI
jgi:hypothetical protein